MCWRWRKNRSRLLSLRVTTVLSYLRSPRQSAERQRAIAHVGDWTVVIIGIVDGVIMPFLPSSVSESRAGCQAAADEPLDLRIATEIERRPATWPTSRLNHMAIGGERTVEDIAGADEWIVSQSPYIGISSLLRYVLDPSSSCTAASHFGRGRHQGPDMVRLSKDHQAW